METPKTPCHACATVCTHALIARSGHADIHFAGGTELQAIRCAVAERRLMLLLPAAHAAEYDQPARFSLWDPTAEDRSVHVIGWTEALGSQERLAVIDAFAAKHPTDDLLALGSEWVLRSVDVAEAQLIWDGEVVNLTLQEL